MPSLLPLPLLLDVDMDMDTLLKNMTANMTANNSTDSDFEFSDTIATQSTNNSDSTSVDVDVDTDTDSDLESSVEEQEEEHAAPSDSSWMEFFQNLTSAEGLQKNITKIAETAEHVKQRVEENTKNMPCITCMASDVCALKPAGLELEDGEGFQSSSSQSNAFQRTEF